MAAVDVAGLAILHVIGEQSRQPRVFRDPDFVHDVRADLVLQRGHDLLRRLAVREHRACMLHARHELVGMLAGLLGRELVLAVEGVRLLQLLVVELREHLSAGQLSALSARGTCARAHRMRTTA